MRYIHKVQQVTMASEEQFETEWFDSNHDNRRFCRATNKTSQDKLAMAAMIERCNNQVSSYAYLSRCDKVR